MMWRRNAYNIIIMSSILLYKLFSDAVNNKLKYLKILDKWQPAQIPNKDKMQT